MNIIRQIRKVKRINTEEKGTYEREKRGENKLIIIIRGNKEQQ